MADESNVIKEEVKDEQDILRRVFNILRENSPEHVGFSLLTVIMPPQVLLEGTKKTIFVNFMDYCKTMRRQPAHVRAFLLAELGTTSDTPDAQQRLVVRGRFTSKNFEGLLRRYVCGYVMCFDCKSTNTTFSREVRLFFVRCEQVKNLYPISFSCLGHISVYGFCLTEYIRKPLLIATSPL
ncbi:PREDICTED: eukaryotic translation initiation factor 2 subunit beta-like [Camelina sativa]|uniref:Eukaryotic translation initiation factor 2 subunit beta-like n=1 Tax=Camelina sativa TaxID=90675 RepID=A0ABM0VQM3_CAMSA|nr:PREDICTED: eukaryotic translation initiation factor 2 subunit beta-like [Camelina sativa]